MVGEQVLRVGHVDATEGVQLWETEIVVGVQLDPVTKVGVMVGQLLGGSEVVTVTSEHEVG